jgi:RimJ/RimL family protein N-acetyltransferase
MLDGPGIRLRELGEGDLQLIADLRNDLDTQAWSRTLPPGYTVEMMRRQYWDRDFSFKPDSAMFIIEEKESAEAIGFVSYIDLKDRHEATLGVVVAQPWWGSGLAVQAVDLVLWMLFLRMGIRVARLWTESSNGRAVGAAQKLGFQPSVRFRSSVFREGTYAEGLMMDVLREEWFAAHPALQDEQQMPWG